MPHVIQKTCTKCGACLPECPTGSIIEGKDKYVIDADTCADHALCVAVCPVDAIVVAPVQKKPAGSKPDDAEEEEL